MKKTLIFLVGETGSGKDTVANKLPFDKIISYTTRPMREYETQGVQHHFISKEEMDIMEERDDLIAWTNTNGIRYCAVEGDLKDCPYIYIINPDGIRWFEENYRGNLNYIVISLYSPLGLRRSRCRTRSDFESSFELRVSAETKDFEQFRINGDFDYIIRNDDSSKSADIIRFIVLYELLQ